MRFSRFMELALYDPQDGYYASGRAQVGRDGDFFTNVSVGPLFGEMLAGQFLEMWDSLGRPDEFTLVEQGANNGQLAADVLDALHGTPLENIRLIIVEPFSRVREHQSTTLRNKNVSWVESPGDLPEFTGVHFSNELFDALPVDLLQAKSQSWHQLLVHERDGFFFFVPSPIADPSTGLPPRPDGFTTEQRTGQSDLLSSLAAKMRRGFLLAIDYGMSRGELLAPHRKAGTIACYKSHQRSSDPLVHPGEQDITAHVDFTSLVHDACAAGFDLSAFTDQHHFLVGAATRLLKSLDGLPPAPDTQKKLRSLRTLLHPETMGTQFKVLLLSKNVSDTSAAPISGFQHAKEPSFLISD
jgi:SAM-dependent MidA family methyltransferase